MPQENEELSHDIESCKAKSMELTAKEQQLRQLMLGQQRWLQSQVSATTQEIALLT